MLLAGDIGGTKTNLALYSAESNLKNPLETAMFASKEYVSLEAIVAEFLTQTKANLECAAFGVAGPVVRGRSEVTNLNWVVDEKNLIAEFGLRNARLMNDLVATASAIPILEEVDIFTLNQGECIDETPIAVIAPGTGLGEAYLTWDGTKYQAHASEGGHSDFAPSDQFELGMLNYLYGKFGHVSNELVCSGLGIPNIYSYLKEIHYAPEPEWLTEALSIAKDPTPVIMSTALEDPEKSQLCTKTLEMFVAILGSEAGNLALTFLATGGVYLGGGIPPRILPALKRPEFLNNFREKGRFSSLMEKIPVHIILNAEAALLGAARVGRELIS